MAAEEYCRGAARAAQLWRLYRAPSGSSSIGVAASRVRISPRNKPLNRSSRAALDIEAGGPPPPPWKEWSAREEGRGKNETWRRRRGGASLYPASPYAVARRHGARGSEQARGKAGGNGRSDAITTSMAKTNGGKALYLFMPLYLRWSALTVAAAYHLKARAYNVK